MTNITTEYQGLSQEEVKRRQKQFGKNELTAQKKESFLKKTFHIICEPMFLLLLIAATIYFLLNEPQDGFIMLVFVVGIISIEQASIKKGTQKQQKSSVYAV